MLKVLYSVPRPSTSSNPYTTLLAQNMRKLADVSFFSWRTALFHRHDILHVHWPEAMVRHPNRLLAVVRLLIGHLYISLLRIRGTAIVQTVHNLTPHESGNWLERCFLRRLSSAVNFHIYLNPSAGSAKSSSSAIILHGHYCDWPPYMVPSVGKKSTLLAFGVLRRYKRLEEAIRAYRNISVDTEDGFLIAGQSADSDYVKSLILEAGTRNDICFDIRRIPDQELARMIATTGAVILPYKEFYNSGAALLALSLGTHIIVPYTETTAELEAEFGSEWVTVYKGNLTAEVLIGGIAKGMAMGGRKPDLSGRDWCRAAAKHLEIYQRLAAREGV